MVRRVVIVVLVGVGAVMCAPAAFGAFPGRDGTIAFSSANENGEDCPSGRDESVFEPCVYSIFRVRSSGRGQKRLSSCGSTADPACDDGSPAYSPGGTKVAFRRGSQLWIMNADGSGARAVGVDGAQPAWAPDGKRIVFTQDGNIAIVRTDGSGLRVLTETGSDAAPAWSTRNVIAFKRFADAGEELFTIRPDGRGRRRVLRDCTCTPADFSPDGRRLLYEVGTTRHALYAADADGRNRRRLVGGGVDGAWSPSGRYIAYIRSSELWLARSDGSGARRLLDNTQRTVGGSITGDYGEPSWQRLPR